jgi:osmoprotectant transport system ATP-binding protein
VGGKADWTAAGLPTEGDHGRPELPDYVNTDAVVVAPHETLARALELARSNQAEALMVVNSERVLLGRLRIDRAADQPDERVSALMDEGPGTVRADADPADLLERMRTRNINTVPVTDPQGRLLGTVHRRALEAATAQSTAPT